MRSLRRRMLGRNPLGRDINTIASAMAHMPVASGAADHGSLAGLGDDDHTQYFNLGQNEIITGQPTFQPASPQSPFLLSANAQGQLVTGLRADQLNKQVIAGDGLKDGGTLTADVTLNVDLATNPGLEISAGALKVLLDGGSLSLGASGLSHSTGDLGDLHTNYPEHDATETISGSWSFSSDIQLGANLDFTGAYSITTTSGDLEITPAGNLITDPIGNSVLPEVTNDINIGSAIKRYATLYAAELYVQTLVAQDVVATIGGRILVAETSFLTTELTGGGTPDTTMYVEHNDFAVNDVLYLEANGNIEWLLVTAGPSGAGPYSYTVTRDYESSGTAHTWNVGDAVVSTGNTTPSGGFIDLFSYQSIGGDVGPSIVGSVRTGSAYNAFIEHWAIGNLNGVYGQSGVYGVGLGRYASGYNYLTITDANGIQFYDDTQTLVGQLTADDWTIGKSGSNHRITITPTALTFYNAGTDYGSLSGTTWRIGQANLQRIELLSSSLDFYDSNNDKLLALGATNGIQMFDNLGTQIGRWYANGDFLLGTAGTTEGNMFYDYSASELLFRSGTTETMKLDTSGNLVIANTASGGGFLRWKSGTTELGRITFVHLPGSGIEWFTFTIDSGLSPSRLFYFQGGDGIQLVNGSLTLSDSTYGTLYTAKGISVGDLAPSPAPAAGEIQATSKIFINESACGDLTYGLCVNIGSGNDNAIVFKQSGLTHGVTSFFETDTWFGIDALNNSTGGAVLRTVSEHATDGRGLVLFGVSLVQDTTPYSTTDSGVVSIISADISGTGGTAIGVDAVLISFENNGSTEALIVGDGQYYSDETATVGTYDEYDDIALLKGIRAMVQPAGHELKKRFGEFITYAKPILEETRVATFHPDGSIFVSTQGLQKLTIDAIRQFYDRQTQENLFLRGRIEQLEKKMALLEA